MAETEPVRRMCCLFCYSDLMLLKYDKRGKAYLSCGSCGVMVFPKTGDIAAIAYKLVAASMEPFMPLLRARLHDYHVALADGKLGGSGLEPGLVSVPAVPSVVPQVTQQESHHASG